MYRHSEIHPSGFIKVIVTEEEFRERISKGVTVVVFTVEWVEESKKLYEELLEALRGFNCNVIEVDVSILPSLMVKENVTSIPSVKVYIDGKTVLVQEGTTGNLKVDVEHIRRALKESMKRRNIPLRK